ncbi:MAG: ribosome biogenesis GTPase Der [Bacteroidales bacterium]|nr:ribosome biogenesis GTPase Der [Bacteroidales bacterium]MCF8343481.1 ribosome biogenesis GTPase Der [Bacteroidales bacterium]MCF8376944.1 ribosome biogenesis GTPase Der [Bacteroidales bacterium]MCF8402144.1 ribosome biogenesis GTPase Der [Bacteroidales bacterium]
MGKILAIVGRPNVGKSTLFNRLTESRDAIVEPTSGVTRDRHYGKCNWNGIEFSLIDTGGYVEGSDDVFETEIRKQVEIAIEEADALLFVVDVKEGLNPMDEEVANFIRRSQKTLFIAANKADNYNLIHDAQEFYAFGLGDIFPVSAINGSGTGELLDAISEEFKESQPEPDINLPKFTVVGRPNVGKSSFINVLTGKDRNIVTPVAGTTRDSIFTPYKLFGFDFVLVDTAGLRKKAKVRANIEFYSVLRSVRAIENSDVCFLMIDATQAFESQDINIFHLIDKNKKGLVIMVNKWDLVEKKKNTHIEFENQIRERISPFRDVPIIFTSVINKQRIFKALEISMKVYENRKRKISTSKFNEVMLPVIQANHPPSGSRNRQVKIKYAMQLPTAYPAFAFYCNHPGEIKDAYRRFLENKIREKFDFTGAPLSIFFRKK